MSWFLRWTWNKNNLSLTTTISFMFTSTFLTCAIGLYGNQNVILSKNTRFTWNKNNLSLTTAISASFTSTFPACAIGLYRNQNIILLKNTHGIFNKQKRTNKKKNTDLPLRCQYKQVAESICFYTKMWEDMNDFWTSLGIKHIPSLTSINKGWLGCDPPGPPLSTFVVTLGISSTRRSSDL